MVKGLDNFKHHFAAHSDKYVLIGGTACTLVMDEVGLDFRATRDLDIVLHIEALDTEFVMVFWDFVKLGGYRSRQKSTGKETFYRFSSPSNRDFPTMLELFSRTPDMMQLKEGSHLTPIPTDEAVSSLSAILLDGEYYQFIHSGKYDVDGLPVVRASHLIPLKARAWLDLVTRRNNGGHVDERDCRKHKNDVIRLYQLLSPTEQVAVTPRIRDDMSQFLDRVAGSESIDLKSLGVKNTRSHEVIETLSHIYQIEPS